MRLAISVLAGLQNKYSSGQALVRAWGQLQQQNIVRQIWFLCSLAWLLFIIYEAIYCQFYTQHIVNAAPGLIGSFRWAITEYWHWLVLSPCLVLALEKSLSRNLMLAVIVFLLFVQLANLMRVELDLHLNPAAEVVVSWVYFWPTQFAYAAFSVLGWCIARRYLHQEIRVSTETEYRPDIPSSAQVHSLPLGKTLQVQTGTEDCEVAVTDVDYIAAARNYMEVFCSERVYLLRSTMKALHDELEQAGFVRIHRSYLVNRHAIRSINSNTVTLRSGQQLPLTSKYRRQALA